MCTFNYVALKNQKWDSEIVNYIAAVHEAESIARRFVRVVIALS